MGKQLYKQIILKSVYEITPALFPMCMPSGQDAMAYQEWSQYIGMYTEALGNVTLMQVHL